MYQTALSKMLKTTEETDQDILKIISETVRTQVSKVEQTKLDDVVRVFFGNVNSLCLFT